MPQTWKNIFPAIKSSAAEEAGWSKSNLVKAGAFDKIRELDSRSKESLPTPSGNSKKRDTHNTLHIHTHEKKLSKMSSKKAIFDSFF